LILVVFYALVLLAISYSFHLVSKIEDPRRRLVKVDIPRLGNDITSWRRMHQLMSKVFLFCACVMVMSGVLILSVDLGNYIPTDIAQTGIFVFLVCIPLYWVQRK
jgi:hypothetical protein